MASSSFTPHLGLCNWSENDRPKRADFISDNGIIDTVLGGHVADTDVHMSAAEKSKALTPFDIEIYAGTGESSQTVTTAFRPSVVLVFKKNEAPVSVQSGVAVVNSAYAVYGTGSSSGIAIGSAGVTVSQEATAQNGRRLSLNEEGCQYVMILIK